MTRGRGGSGADVSVNRVDNHTGEVKEERMRGENTGRTIQEWVVEEFWVPWGMQKRWIVICKA